MSLREKCSVFLIAINGITNCVQFPFSQRLSADDYNITLQSSDPSRAHRLLQKVLDKITNWASSPRGFRFSSLKTFLLVFKKRKPTPTLPPLYLQNFQIKTTELTFLGLLFHTLPGIPLCPETQMKTTGMEAEEHVSKRICMCDMSG